MRKTRSIKSTWSLPRPCFFVPLLAALVCSSCGKKGADAEKLKARLGWLVNANSAGQIVALEKGYYREKGLDVELLPGGLSNSSVQTVSSGADNVGFANSPDLVIQARAAGAPLKIIAVIHQEGYHGFFVRADSDIHSPRDWVGKRVGVKHGSPTFMYYRQICKKLNIDRSQIKEIPVKYGVKSFLNGDLDVYPGALTNEAIAIEKKGVEIRAFTPEDFGIQTWGNVIFTSERELEAREDRIRKFVQATLKGWKFCLDPANEDVVLACLKRHSDRLDIEKERLALRTTLNLVNTKGLIGSIDENELQKIIGNMQKFGLLSEQLKPAEIIKKVNVIRCYTGSKNQ